MGGALMNVRGITNPDMSTLINGAVAAGWVHVGTKSNHTRGVIRWPATGEEVTYSTTPARGAWKSRANEIFQISGVDLRRHGSNRRSRKNFAVAVDPQVEASRRRHAEAWSKEEGAREAAAAAERQRQAEIRTIQAAERRRREIEDLMR